MKELSFFTDLIGKKDLVVTAINKRHSHLNEERHVISDIADAQTLYNRQNLCNFTIIDQVRKSKVDKESTPTL